MRGCRLDLRRRIARGTETNVKKSDTRTVQQKYLGNAYHAPTHVSRSSDGKCCRGPCEMRIVALDRSGLRHIVLIARRVQSAKLSTSFPNL
jgi:hypothetical protein